MADEQEQKRSQGRSPPFPFISLERALARLQEFSDYSRGHPARMASAVNGAWKYNPKSSGGIQTVAALKGFGLITDSGSNEDRRIQVSDLGKRLLRKPPMAIRRAFLQEAALNPRVLGDLWKEWGDNRPPDDECVWTLTDKRGFTVDAAAKLLAVYDATITYADLARSDSLSEITGDIDAFEIGSFDEDGTSISEPIPAGVPRPSKTVHHGSEDSTRVAANRHPEWTERLRDREGVEIIVEFSREPSQAAYEYLRDYIDFKLGATQHKTNRVEASQLTDDATGTKPND